MQQPVENETKGLGIVYFAGVFVFMMAAMGFFNRLFWIMLIVQRSMLPDALPQAIAEQIEILEVMEAQIPLFHGRLLYGLVLNSLLVIGASGILRFSDTARRATQFLLGFDALVFLALAIHYRATGYVPRMVEQFHLRFFIAVIRVIMVMFLSSPIFVKSLSEGSRLRRKRREASDQRKDLF